MKIDMPDYDVPSPAVARARFAAAHKRLWEAPRKTPPTVTDHDPASVQLQQTPPLPVSEEQMARAIVPVVPLLGSAVDSARIIDFAAAVALLRPTPIVVLPGVITVDRIVALVCAFYQVERVDIKSHRRHQHVCRPRQVAMYLARYLTSYSFPQIGRQFGGRDHTTVIAAVRRVTEFMLKDSDFCHEIATLQTCLEGLR